MKTYKIGVIPGDGVGPEVIREGIKVIEAASQKSGFKIEWLDYDFGAERFLRTGEVLPDSALEEFKTLDVIYLGAVGDPRVETGVLEKGLLLKIRFGLEQYINLRPVKLYPGVWTPIKDKSPEDIDFVIIRENTEGLYSGRGKVSKQGTTEEVAIQESVNTYKGVERCIRFAFEYTQKRNKDAKLKKLTLVDKANVLTYEGKLWRRVLTEVGKEFSDIKREFAFVDATCMWMVKNPEWFDVIVTCNMFGDIITDLGAMVQGGLGVAAGGNINPEGVSMFEPIHGSAPKYAGRNVINPIATILAGSMMLKTLGEDKGSELIEDAVKKALTSGKLKSMEAGKMGMNTQEVGDFICRLI